MNFQYLSIAITAGAILLAGIVVVYIIPMLTGLKVFVSSTDFYTIVNELRAKICTLEITMEKDFIRRGELHDEADRIINEIKDMVNDKL
jgi:hypothetical protein